MESLTALKVLAEVSGSQWGLVTSAQAVRRGVSHMNLSRLTDAGDLVRMSHGVYRDAGAPGGEHDELRAAWLATDPARLAYERLRDRSPAAVVSGESAARLHRMGDLRATRIELTTPARRQTQRDDVHYRTRVLPGSDVTVLDGLPTTTRERTIADLVEDRQDLSVVGAALRDAARQSRLDTGRLVELLGTLATRHGHAKGDGAAVLEQLLDAAGISEQAIAAQLSKIPRLRDLVAAEAVTRGGRMIETGTATVDAMHLGSVPVSSVDRLDSTLRGFEWVNLALATRSPDEDGTSHD